MEEKDLKNYDKKIYQFTPQEIAKITPWQAQVELAFFAEKMIAGILREECLKRAGVKNSPDIKVEYSLQTDQFFAYIPKIWCVTHDNRKAEFSYQNKAYCLECAETIKKQLQEKQPEEKKKTKKKK